MRTTEERERRPNRASRRSSLGNPSGSSDQSMALNVMPAWATDGIATRTPETTKKIPANSQPRTRRIMTLASLTGLTEELMTVRRGQGIRWESTSNLPLNPCARRPRHHGGEQKASKAAT